jgi:hypothetical protein
MLTDYDHHSISYFKQYPPLSPHITSWTSSLSTGNLPAGLIYDCGLFCFNSRGHQLVKATRGSEYVYTQRCVNCIKMHSKFCFTITQAHHDASGHIRLTWPTDPMISVAFFVLLYSEHWLLFCYLSMTIQYIQNNFTIRFQTSHQVKNVIPTQVLSAAITNLWDFEFCTRW